MTRRVMEPRTKEAISSSSKGATSDTKYNDYFDEEYNLLKINFGNSPTDMDYYSEAEEETYISRTDKKPRTKTMNTSKKSNGSSEDSGPDMKMLKKFENKKKSKKRCNMDSKHSNDEE